MQQSYSLIIRDKKYDGYKKIASFIFLINAIVFISLGIHSESVSNKLILITCSIILAVYAVYSWSYKKKKERSFIVVYLLVAIVWLTDTSWWYFSIPFLLLLFLQWRMESDFMISIHPQQVIIDGFLKNEHPWSDFNTIVLKDGLLSLDFRSNKVLQVEPDLAATSSLPGSVSWEDENSYWQIERDFNDFCQQQLRSVAKP